MNKFRKYLTWYYMLSKRLLHKWSYVLLLLTIPVIMLASDSVMSQESGILHIALCNESDSKTADDIISSLHDNTLLRFSECESEKKATLALTKHKFDAVWIFPENFDDILSNFPKKENDAKLFKVLEREENIPLKLSREVLYGAIYSNLSYSTYKNYVQENFNSHNKVSEEYLREEYDRLVRGRKIVEIYHINSEKPKESVNYLTAPLRGILSLLVMLCTLASAMYFLSDTIQGKYNWLSPQKRIIPAFATCFAGALFPACAMFIALIVSGISVGIFHELASVLLYTFACCGFCVLLCTFLRSPGKLGATIPGLIIIMLVLSPIFFNMKILRPVRLMLPPYYYLYSTYNSMYFLYSLIYCIVIYIAAFLSNMLLCNKGEKRNVI